MLAGHLREKKGLFYIVLNLKDENGVRKAKWIPTGLPVKGNKKRAEELLIEARKSYVEETACGEPEVERCGTLFADFLEEWLEIAKANIELITYSSYTNMAKGVICPYFREKGIMLEELQTKEIQDFYTEQLKRVTANTVIHYHAVIHKSLKYALKVDLILQNPASKVDRPKKNKFVGGFYDSGEINKLFDVAKGTRLELGVLFGAFYGLRRSEIIGLKWNAIDFKNNTITIRHTVTAANIDGKHVLIEKDRTKNKSSFRTLPLVAKFREMLLDLKAEQERCKKLCKRSYNTDYLDYLYVDEIGGRVNPSYLTTQFPVLLEKNGMRKIRFHDLRHSCASLLLANGVSMKQIQEWLGHSTFATTADTYSHLDYSSKLSSAAALSESILM